MYNIHPDLFFATFIRNNCNVSLKRLKQLNIYLQGRGSACAGQLRPSGWELVVSGCALVPLASSISSLSEHHHQPTPPAPAPGLARAGSARDEHHPHQHQRRRQEGVGGTRDRGERASGHQRRRRASGGRQGQARWSRVHVLIRTGEKKGERIRMGVFFFLFL